MAPQTPAVVMDKYVGFTFVPPIEANIDVYTAELVIQN